jgi:hypothetical protein
MRHEWENADPELRSELGSLLLSFSQLEESLADAVWMIVGLDGIETRILTYRMPFSRLVDKFAELFALKYPSFDADHLRQFCAALRKAGDDRNDLTHALWVFDTEAGLVQRHKVQKDKKRILRLDTDTVTPAKVRELVSRISALDDKLWELVIDQQPVA